MIVRGFNALGFAVQHLVKATGKLLWYTSLARSGVGEEGERARRCRHSVGIFLVFSLLFSRISHMRNFVVPSFFRVYEALIECFLTSFRMVLKAVLR